MKKILLPLFLGFISLSTYADALPDGLVITIGKTTLTTTNCRNMDNAYLKSGMIDYDVENQILHLQSATIEASDVTPVISISGGTKPVTIMVEGSCEVTCTASGGNALESRSELILTTIGGGDIKFTSTNNRGVVMGKNLTVNNGLSVTIKGGSYALIGELADSQLPKLIVDGSQVVLQGYFTFTDMSGLELTDCELPSDIEWSDEKNCIVYKSDKKVYSGDVEITRESGVYYARLTSSEYGAGKLEIYKDGVKVSNPYKHKGAVDLTLKAEKTEHFLFIKYENNSTLPERNVTTSTYLDNEYVATFKWDVQSKQPWYVLSEKKVYKSAPYLGSFAKYDDEMYFPSMTPVTSSCIATSATKGQMLFVKGATLTAGLGLREFNSEDVKETTLIGNVLTMQSDYFPIYAVAIDDSQENVAYAIAKNQTTMKNVLMKIDLSAKSWEQKCELSIEKPITAMTIHQSLFYVIEEDDTNAKMYVMGNLADLVLLPVKICRLGVGSKYDQEKRNAIGIDPFTKEVFWLQADAYDQMLRAVDLTTGLSHFIKSHDFKATGFFQLNEMAQLSLAVNDDEKGSVQVEGAYIDKGRFAKGSKVSIKANAYGDCKFVKWNDDNTDNPREIEITGDVTYTAEFAWKDGIVEYPIWVSNKKMRTNRTSFTKANTSAIKSGNLIYDPENNILTMDNIEIENNEYSTVMLGQSGTTMAPLTINLVGTNSIKSTFTNGNALSINNWDVKFVGTGSLTINCTMNADAIALDKANVTFEGVTVDITANKYGVVGSTAKTEQVTIRGSHVKVKGGQGSMLKLGGVSWEYCDVTPATIVFANNQIEDGSDHLVKTQITFKSLPMVRAYPMEEGTGSFTIKSSDKTFTNLGWFPENTDIYIIPNPASGFEFGRWTGNLEWGDKTHPEKWWPEELGLVKSASDESYEGLFYAKTKSTATWYAMNDDKFVSFKMSEHAHNAAIASAPSAAGYYAGEFRNGKWEFRTATGVSAMPFSSLADGEDIPGKDNIEQVIDNSTVPILDMAYDLVHKEMYAVYDTKMYRYNYADKTIEELGEIYDHKNNKVYAKAIAADAKGTLYVLENGITTAWLYTVAKIDKDLKRIDVEPVGGEDGAVGVPLNSGKHSMAFDHATGELFWAGYDYIRILDTKTAKAHIVGDFGMKRGSQGAMYSLHRASKMVSVNVHVATGCESMGTASADHTSVIAGTKVTLTAKANDGYKFTYWTRGTEDDDTHYETTPYTFTANGNATWYAHFKKSSEDVENVSVETQATKILLGGQLFIIRDGKVYNALGQLIQ